MSSADAKRFRICREAGRGKRARVYEAIDTLLHRRVALKVACDPAFQQDLVEESQRLARVQSPHVVTLYDAVFDDEAGLVLEWLSGKTLRQVLQSHSPLPFDNVRRWTADLLSGLDAAHRVDVLHGDLKPENLWIDPADRLRVFDFGMTPRPGGDATALYAAPEVLEGQAHSIASDLYSAGSIVFELLTGQPPYDGVDATELAQRKRRQRAPRIDASGGTVPEEIETWIARLLERESEHRFESAEDALRAWRQATEARSAAPRRAASAPRAVHADILEQLTRAFSGTGSQAGIVVTLDGESGTGKSWMLEQLANARREHPRLVSLSGSPSHAAALDTWIAGIPSWIGAPGETRHLQDLVARFESDSKRDTTSRDVLLLVDDFEECDETTRRLLVLLAQQATRLRLGMLLCANPFRLRAALPDWCALQNAASTCLTLHSVPAERMACLLEPASEDDTIPDALLHYVHALCGGIPRYALHLFEDLIQGGELLHHPDGWTFQAPVEDRIPARSRPHLERALLDRTAEQRELLVQAALIGPSFSIADLAAQQPDDIDRLAQLCHDLVRNTDLLTVHQDLHHFVVPLLQMDLEESLAAPQRRRAHQEIAARLQQQPEADAAQVGRHLFLSGQLDAARPWLQAAGEAAFERHELETARRHLHLALRCLETEPADEAEALSLADLLLLQASTLLGLASWENALALIARCLLLSQAWGLSQQTVRALRTRGRIHYKRGRFDDAITTLREAQSQATEAEDALEAQEIVLQIGNIDFECGRLDAALEGYLEALLFASEHDNTDLEARASNNVALVTSTMGNKPEAIRMFHRSLQLFGKLGRQDAVARIQHNIGMTYLDLRNWREARNHFRESIRIASRIGLDEMVAVSRLEHAETSLRLGRLEEATPDIDKALLLCQQRNDPLGTATAYRLQGMAAALEGDVRRAEEHLEHSITLLRGLGVTPHLGLALQERGRVRLEAGHADTARPDLDEARRIFTSLETPHEGLEEINSLWERCQKQCG